MRHVTVRDRPRQAHRHLHRQGARRRAARRHRRHRGRRRRLVPAADGARAGRRDPVDAHQRARHRHLADQDRRRRRGGAGDGRHAAGAQATTGWCARPSACCAARFSRLDVSSRSLFALIEPGSCFAGTLARTGAGLRPQLPAGAARRRGARAEDHRRRSQLRPLPDGHRPEPPAAPLLRRAAGAGRRARQGRPAARRRRRVRAGPGHQRRRTTSTGPTRRASPSRSAWR